MGKRDDYQYDYLDNCERFADQVNGALFGGRQVVKPDELEPADVQAVYLGTGSDKREDYKTIVDKARMWRGRLIHIITIQNQTYVDYRMVLRNMLAESIGYHKQWKQKKTAHEAAKDHNTMENGKERYNMIKAFEDYRLEGKMDGKYRREDRIHHGASGGTRTNSTADYRTHLGRGQSGCAE